MISVSDAARFAEENVGTRKFKPWWNIILNYFIFGLLLLALFSWTKVILAETLDTIYEHIVPCFRYSLNLAKYFNSRCAQAFTEKLLIYYPYVLYAQ